MVDACRVHIQVRHETQTNQPGGQNTLGFERGQQRRASPVGHIHKHNIRLRRTHVKARQALQALSQPLCQSMVIGQPVDMVVQCVQSRSRQNAGLPQATAQNLAPAQRLGDQFTRATQGRAHGRAQTFAEANRHAVEVVHDAPHAGRDGPTVGLRHGRIEKPGTVQMHGQAVLPGERCSLRQIGRRHGVPIPGVFQRQQACAGKVTVDGFDGCRDVGQRHFPHAVLCQRLRLDAAQHGCTAAFIAVSVGVLAHDVLVAPLAMRHQGAQVALRARRHEQRRFFAGDLRDARLQGVDCGVVAKHIVTQGRSQHGLAHGRSGLGHGVAAQINGCVHGRTKKFLSMA